METGNTLSKMFEDLGNALKPYTDLMELAALWTGKTRYVKGDQVVLDKSLGTFTKDAISPTHKITKLMGNLQDSKHEVYLEDLTTSETYLITL